MRTWSQFMLYMMTSTKDQEVVAHYNGKLTALNNSEVIDTNVMWNMSQWDCYYWVAKQNTGENCLAVLTVTILQLW